MSYTASCSSRTSIGTVSWQAACLSFALLFSAAVNAGSTPANDALKSSIGIAGRSGEIALSTRDATREATEPQVSEIPNAVSVWYRFQPFVRGPLTLRLKGAPSDSRSGVYEQRGYPLNFSVLTAVGSGPSVTFPTALRTTYVIGVLSTESGVGDFTLAWEQDVAEDNDIDLAVPAESVRSRVQVREFDHVAIDQGQSSNPGSAEILQRRAANSAAADQHHMRPGERDLSCPANLRQDNVAGEAGEAFGRQ